MILNTEKPGLVLRLLAFFMVVWLNGSYAQMGDDEFFSDDESFFSDDEEDPSGDEDSSETQTHEQESVSDSETPDDEVEEAGDSETPEDKVEGDGDSEAEQEMDMFGEGFDEVEEEKSYLESDDEDKDEAKVSKFENATLEGIQLSKEPAEADDEYFIECYFIFRDDPTNYFYETKVREKKIVFDFDDAVLGGSPIKSEQLSPIQGFRVESEKIDANADMQGLKPEWHDRLRITFFLDQVPKIDVSKEMNIVSFKFKWSSNEEKLDELVLVDNTRKVIILSCLGIAAVGGGVLTYYLLDEPEGPGPPEPLSTDDLPERPEASTGVTPLFRD